MGKAEGKKNQFTMAIFYNVPQNRAHANNVRGDACRKSLMLAENIENYPSVEAIEEERQRNPRIRNKKVNRCKKCLAKKTK